MRHYTEALIKSNSLGSGTNYESHSALGTGDWLLSLHANRMELVMLGARSIPNLSMFPRLITSYH